MPSTSGWSSRCEQQLLDEAAGAGLDVADLVGALGEQHGVDHAVLVDLEAGEHLLVEAGEVDADRGADVGRLLVAG